MHEELGGVIDATLSDLTRRLDALDRDDLDTEQSDGKVVVEFEDGTKIIVSRQGATGQIWLAEPNGGWHFDYRTDKWICDKRGVELFENLSSLISDRVGYHVAL
jgi:CyaY protein